MPELVGQPIDRIDGRLKVTGRATYAYEHKIPNAVRAVIVTSTVAKGRIASIDSKDSGSNAGRACRNDSPERPETAAIGESTESAADGAARSGVTGRCGSVREPTGGSCGRRLI